ncbi:MAG: AI-2E family transporter [Rhizobiaceae bacterium]|nr:AI-2E family transporter [Rhizobiaceae bacterium]MCV0407280.1 AI-2E family transporter [Rhizobiaceae bacterium]
MSTPSIEEISFVVVVIVVTAAFFWLLLPFYGAVLWAVILSILFNPLHRRLERRLSGRSGLAAAISLLACICIVVIPGSVILSSLAAEATSLYSRINSSEIDAAAVLREFRNALPTALVEWFSTLNLGSFEDIQSRLTSFLGQGLQAIATRLVSIGQGTAQVFISLGLMLYVLFFLFRDGARLASIIRRASPLSQHHTDYILAKFSAVVKATVKGNVIIAVVQGTIGGVTFWLLGIPAALLWGVCMAVLSLLPAIGAALVWIPVSAYLLLSGQYLKGVVLIVVGVFIISLVDNFLRPPLVGRGTRMPDYVVLVSTLGGLSLFGMNGFVIGPLIAALFIAVWSLFTDDRHHILRSPQE